LGDINRGSHQPNQKEKKFIMRRISKRPILYSQLLDSGCTLNKYNIARLINIEFLVIRLSILLDTCYSVEHELTLYRVEEISNMRYCVFTPL
jgi:hypothetical protein